MYSSPGDTILLFISTGVMFFFCSLVWAKKCVFWCCKPNFCRRFGWVILFTLLCYCKKTIDFALTFFRPNIHAKFEQKFLSKITSYTLYQILQKTLSQWEQFWPIQWFRHKLPCRSSPYSPRSWAWRCRRRKCRQ